VIVNILTRVEEIIPRWKIVPTKDVIDAAFKDPIKREEVSFRVILNTHLSSHSYTIELM
jgi:hypothetical protein